MAFDGSIIACLTDEFNKKLLNGRITKISQPEKEELLLTIKKDADQKRLLISVNPSLPIIYLTDENKTAPLSAPSFCMFLRKNIQNGRIIGIYQTSMDRIINFDIEHFNEMGDICVKTLTIELMGKHSNIIIHDGNKILESIKHINASISSIREVLPGRDYFIPFEGEKFNPFSEDTDLVEVLEKIKDNKADSFNNISPSTRISSVITGVITGFSPQLSEEVLCRASIDSDRPISSLNHDEVLNINQSYKGIVSQISNKNFTPEMYFNNKEPLGFSALESKIYSNCKKEKYESISALLCDFYSQKQKYTGLRQKTSDIRNIVQNLLNKNYKKYDLQLKQIKDTEKKDKYRLYGELITAYGYNVPQKSTFMTAIDYHNGDEIKIPLDPEISPIENGKKYFEKYSKLKRTSEALSSIIKDTKEEIDHLESIAASLDTARNEADISDIKREMTESGYIKNNHSLNNKRTYNKQIKSAPLHFQSIDGFNIFVGKNNFQNEYVTFKMAEPNDWWFHAKKLPGSHVIIKAEGREISETAFNTAGRLAAHFSKAEGSAKVEIDYIQRKYIKKPAGAKPGYVIYHTNYSMISSTNIEDVKEIE